METVVPGLHASEPEDMGFGPDLPIRAYLLEREQGNLLLYRSAGVERDADAIDALGGIERQHLNHWHEASPACDRVAERFGAPLHVHAADADEVARVCRVAETFDAPHRVGDDLEVIPTPGHTPGATTYLWHGPEHRVLFCGDTLWLRRDRLVAAVLDGSDRARYVESLERLRELEIDLIVPAISQPPHLFVEPAEAKRRIEEVLVRLRRGERR